MFCTFIYETYWFCFSEEPYPTHSSTATLDLDKRNPCPRPHTSEIHIHHKQNKNTLIREKIGTSVIQDPAFIAATAQPRILNIYSHEQHSSDPPRNSSQYPSSLYSQNKKQLCLNAIHLWAALLLTLIVTLL